MHPPGSEVAPEEQIEATSGSSSLWVLCLCEMRARPLPSSALDGEVSFCIPLLPRLSASAIPSTNQIQNVTKAESCPFRLSSLHVFTLLRSAR